MHWKVYILCLTQMTLCNHFQFKHSRAIALLGDAFARSFSILIWISQIFANRNEFVWRFRLTSSHDKRTESAHLRPFTQQWWHFTLNFMARIKIASNLAEFYCLQGAKASVHFGLEQDHHHHHTRGARSDGRGMRSLKITVVQGSLLDSWCQPTDIPLTWYPSTNLWQCVSDQETPVDAGTNAHGARTKSPEKEEPFRIWCCWH